MSDILLFSTPDRRSNYDDDMEVYIMAANYFKEHATPADVLLYLNYIKKGSDRYLHRFMDVYNADSYEEANIKHKVSDVLWTYIEVLRRDTTLTQINDILDVFRQLINKGHYELSLRQGVDDQQERKVLVLSYFKLCKFISDLLCGYISFNSIEEYNTRIDDNMCIIFNETGFFSLGGYMHLFRNKLVPIGFPDDISYFDNSSGCPGSFVVHDLLHNSHVDNIFRSERYNLLVDAYIEVMNDESLSVTDKETNAFFLWMFAHYETQDALSDVSYFNMLGMHGVVIGDYGVRLDPETRERYTLELLRNRFFLNTKMVVNGYYSIYIRYLQDVFIPQHREWELVLDTKRYKEHLKEGRELSGRELRFLEKFFQQKANTGLWQKDRETFYNLLDVYLSYSYGAVNFLKSDARKRYTMHE